jgi:hypothetical protein
MNFVSRSMFTLALCIIIVLNGKAVDIAAVFTAAEIKWAFFRRCFFDGVQLVFLLKEA